MEERIDSLGLEYRTPETRRQEREELEFKVEAFLAAGGEIKKVPSGVLCSQSLNPRYLQKAQRLRRIQKQRELKKSAGAATPTDVPAFIHTSLPMSKKAK